MNTYDKLEILISQTSGTLQNALMKLQRHAIVQPTYRDPYFHRLNSDALPLMEILEKAGISFYTFNESYHKVANGIIFCLTEDYLPFLEDEYKERFQNFIGKSGIELHEAVPKILENNNIFPWLMGQDFVIVVKRFPAINSDFRAAYVDAIKSRKWKVTVAIENVKNLNDSFPEIAITEDSVIYWSVRSSKPAKDITDEEKSCMLVYTARKDSL